MEGLMSVQGLKSHSSLGDGDSVEERWDITKARVSRKVNPFVFVPG